MSKSNKLYVFYGTSGGGIGNISEVARMPIATKQIGHYDTPSLLQASSSRGNLGGGAVLE